MAAKIKSADKPRLVATLRDRYGDDCHWCGKPLCFETKEEPLSATIEHLVPKFEGGTNEQTNLRLAHSECNNRRHNPLSLRTRHSMDRWNPRRAQVPYPAPRSWA